MHSLFDADIYVEFYRDQATRSHLKNVYAALTLSTFLAAGGAAVHIFTDILKVCSSLILMSTVEADLFIDHVNFFLIFERPPQNAV